jgi:nucleotide-binding universal stress UspA family protein
MFRSILVPIDGSPFSEQALPWAVAVGKRTGAILRLMYVYPPSTEVLLESSPFYDEDMMFKVRTKQRAYLDGITKKLSETVKVEQLIEEGEIAETIKNRAVHGGSDLVVMATHARGAVGRFFLGSVADELVRTLPMPLLLVHPREIAPGISDEVSLRRILVPLDGSPFAEQILMPAQSLAESTGAELTLMRVVQPIPATEVVPIELGAQPMYVDLTQRLGEAQQNVLNQARKYVEDVSARLKPHVKGVHVHVVENHPADEILLHATPERTDLVAIATHGRRGLARLILGSVADKVIRGSRVPVLVLRPKPA